MNMRKEKNSIRETRRGVLAECARVMCSSILINAAAEVFANTLIVVTANTLGTFTDAALKLDLGFGIRNMWLLIGCILLTVIVAPLVALCGDFTMLKCALRHDIVIFGRFFDKEFESVAALQTGELQYELEDAPNALRIQMVILMSKAIAIPFCLGYLLFCVGSVSWPLTAILFVLAAVRLVVPIIFRKKLAHYDVAAKAYFAKRRSYEVDVVSSPHVIKLWGICIPIQKRFERLFEAYYAECGAKYDACKAFLGQTNAFVSSFTLILLFAAGAAMVARGDVSPGQFASVLVYLNVAQTILGNVGEIIQGYPLMMNAANRVTDFYRDREPAEGQPVSAFHGIKGENVQFAFGDKIVLNGLDFELMPGEKAVLTGENGSGKSTLGKIIATLIKRYGGTIEINGADMKGITPASLRSVIAYAPQVPYLFEATVRENVCMGNPDVSREHVDKLLDAFGMLPLAERKVSIGSDLSGGERQKVSILRALLKKADLLILDEPTNHLDQESIQMLKRHLAETTQTILIISHDPELLKSIEKTIVI